MLMGKDCVDGRIRLAQNALSASEFHDHAAVGL